MKGNLIVFEGPDGSGKTSQLAKAFSAMTDGGVPVVNTRHPGGTDTGKALRAIIKDKVFIDQMPPLARRLIFTVDRLTHMSELSGMLEQNTVLMDRWDGISNRGYGTVEGTTIDDIKFCEAIGAGMDVPVDLALIFSVKSEVAWERTDHEDVADSNWDLFQKVNAEYGKMAYEADRWKFVVTLSGKQIPAVRIDANGSIDMTHKLVMEAIKRL
jgi:dTMP kinase